MSARPRPTTLAALLAALLLSGCGTPPSAPPAADVASYPRVPGSEAPAPGAAGDLIIAAMTYLDRPYQAGGNSVETGFDCSGFTRHVFGQALGLELPRSALEQAQAPQLRPVARSALQAGDLVFFNTQRRAFSHVGIYLGDAR